MRAQYHDVMSPKLKKAIKKLGADIAIARKKRDLSMGMMCERTALSMQTYRRVEQGDPSVSLGALAMVLFALGESHRINTLIDVATDDVGLLNDIANLPKRIRRPK